MDAIRQIVQKYWGYTQFRPLQLDAMAAAVQGRDSLAVLPTGGGKSLCYQAPALLSDRLTVVVSPLIALMKDQVDTLIGRGIPAAFFNSSLDAGDRRRVTTGIERREYKLIFVAPERFNDERFNEQIDRVDVGSFAIDEAHCISHWGHDFRIEYRQLDQLRKRFPKASIHAFTATATPRVQEDIVAQLGLADPILLVGDFFRPNLTYQVFRRKDAFQDVVRQIRKHPGQGGIVYAIRRIDVDDLAAQLQSAGIKARGYHAGMGDQERTATQDAFAARETDVVVATVAFGMGIDRSDIRFVIHAAMPKTIEHYQQETGRAGRDGKPADCVLFYSGSDFQLWKSITLKDESPNEKDQLALLSEMYAYCQGASCRHRRLVTYFGQPWDRDSCHACDVCNNTVAVMPDATVVAQKIMSCIVRTGERFGAAYIAEVLRGDPNERAVQFGHDRLSTFGLIPDQRKHVLMSWMDQLVDQGMLERTADYRVLKVAAKGWHVLRSQLEARLFEIEVQRGKRDGARLKRKTSTDSQVDATSNETRAAKRSQAEPAIKPLDAASLDLFEKLRDLRREIALGEGVPAFMVCGDRTLRDMARKRPTSRDAMLDVVGIGPAKYSRFGERFLDVIRRHVKQANDSD